MASTGVTVGDVYTSLLHAHPSGRPQVAAIWPRIAEAISREADVDPPRIGLETVLLAKSTTRWTILAVAMVFAVLLAWDMVE